MKYISNETHTITLSLSNSTKTPLSGGATFTGEWEEVLDYSSISVIADSDVASTLYCDFSIDGVTSDRNIQMSDGTSGSMGIHSLIVVARYFRVRVVNGAGAQSSLRVQTLYSIDSRIAQPTSRLAQTISNYSDVLNTRAVIVAQEPDGTYSNILSSANNELLVKNGMRDVFNTQIIMPLDVEVSLYSNYGIVNNTQLVDTFTATGGTITSFQGNRFQADITTSSGSYAVVRSKRASKYHPGLSNLIRLQYQFDGNAVANSLQYVGAGNASSDLYFCYNGADFGIRYSTGGLFEIQTLTMSAAAGGTESLTITLNSVGYTFNVSNAGGDISFTAHEIEEGSSYGSLWNIEHIGNDIIFIASAVGVRNGTYSFANNTGGGTAAGSFAQTKAGVALTTTFVAQADWNGPSSMVTSLNPNNINLYEIAYAWFGTSNVFFRVYNPDTDAFEDVHKLKYANQGTDLSFSSPNLYPTFGVASLGSTTALTTYCTCLFSATQGTIDILKNPRSAFIVNKAISANTETVIAVVTSRRQVNGFPSQSIIYLDTASVAVDGNRPVIFKIIKNPTTLSADSTTDYTSYTYFNSTTSLLLYDTTTDTYTGGTLVNSFQIGKNGSLYIDLLDKDEFITPEDEWIFTVESTAINTVDIALSFIEDY